MQKLKQFGGEVYNNCLNTVEVVERHLSKLWGDFVYKTEIQ